MGRGGKGGKTWGKYEYVGKVKGGQGKEMKEGRIKGKERKSEGK